MTFNEMHSMEASMQGVPVKFVHCEKLKELKNRLNLREVAHTQTKITTFATVPEMF